ncbi:hypothetical protein DFS34DRAFT_616225 [Phlyctochytrium arcticum]|nr:hypothetical protein DFS34DRAFT_616225 [Phlyctochytrium arcticum]
MQNTHCSTVSILSCFLFILHWVVSQNSRSPNLPSTLILSDWQKSRIPPYLTSIYHYDPKLYLHEHSYRGMESECVGNKEDLYVKAQVRTNPYIRTRHQT